MTLLIRNSVHVSWTSSNVYEMVIRPIAYRVSLWSGRCGISLFVCRHTLLDYNTRWLVWFSRQVLSRLHHFQNHEISTLNSRVTFMAIIK